MTRLRFLPLLAFVALLAACSATPAGPSVASLAAAPPPASSGAPSSDGSGAPGATPTPTPTSSGGDVQVSGRPQLRMDDSPDRVRALWNAYNQCLVDNGAQRNTGQAPGAAGPGQNQVVVVVEPVPAAAKAACADKLPEQPPQLDPALNPRYHDDFVAWVACIRDRGVAIHMTTAANGGLGWTFDNDHVQVPDDMSRIQDECQLQAFGANK